MFGSIRNSSKEEEKTPKKSRSPEKGLFDLSPSPRKNFYRPQLDSSGDLALSLTRVGAGYEKHVDCFEYQLIDGWSDDSNNDNDDE